MKVYKNHEFVTGDYLTDGTEHAQITSVDTSNADYDKLNLGGTSVFGSGAADLSAGDIVEQADGASATYKYTPNAVCYGEAYVEDRNSSNVAVAAAINAKVIQNNLPYPLTTSSSTGSGSNQKGALETQITFL